MREQLVPKRWESPEVLWEIYKVSVPDKKKPEASNIFFSVDVLFGQVYVIDELEISMNCTA